MAIVNLPDKICSHCNGSKWHYCLKKSGFNIKTGERYIYSYYRCVVLLSEQAKQRHIDIMNNPERLEIKHKRNTRNQSMYRKRHPERVKEQKKEEYLKHKDTHRLRKQKSDKKRRKELSDLYIIETIIHVKGSIIKKSDVSKELIEIQRKSIKLQRQIKQNKTHVKSNKNNSN